MAEAIVTIKLSTTEFKLVEQALRSLNAVHGEIVSDRESTAKERQKAREVQAQAQDLLRKLA